MSQSFDLFPIAPSEPDAVGRGQENVRRSAKVTAYTTPCASPWCGPPQHRCSVGGGDAAHSNDNGRTWQCVVHLADFSKRRAA